MSLARAQYLTSLHFNGSITPQQQQELSLLVLQLKDEELQLLLDAEWKEHVPGTTLPDEAAEDMLKTIFARQSTTNRSAMALHVATGKISKEPEATTGNTDNVPVIKMQPAETQRRIIPMLLKLSGAAAVVFAIFFFTVKPAENSSSKPVVKTFSAAAGERKNFQLPDGSVVTLNSGSTITINEQYAVNTRDIYLQGEAFFDVKHNKSLPFIVHTPAMDVKAVGTAFNVKAYPGEKLSEATLVRGAVEVTLKQEQNRKLMLSPNEKIKWQLPAAEANQSVSKTTNNDLLVAIPAQVVKLLKTEDGDIKETAWKDNKLVFTDESLADIAVQLERWYGAKITFADTAISNYRFTGIFEREELESVLGILKESRHFNFKITHGEITKVNLYK